MSTNPEARAWVEVRADALRENYALLGGGVGPGAGLLPMVKADAYGIGVERTLQVLEPFEPWGFGVATVDEGLALRAFGVDRPVVVLSPVTPGQIEAAVAGRLHLSVSSRETLAAAAAASDGLTTPAFVHVDVDTGMGRSGFDWRRSSEWLPSVQAAASGAVEWVGCHTHLHSADEDPSSVCEQWDRLRTVLDAIQDPPPGLMVHVLNSAGVFRAPEYARSLIRPGIFLYGGEIGVGQPTPRPVVSVRARVVHVRDATEGTTLGYGVTYRASRPERWATLSIGYGDGIPRTLGNRGSVLVGGHRVPIIGRISMDATVVDISDVSGVAVGDVATVIGTQGDKTISLDEVALEAGTISYEILTGLTARLPRVWKTLDG